MMCSALKYIDQPCTYICFLFYCNKVTKAIIVFPVMREWANFTRQFNLLHENLENKYDMHIF